MPAEVCGARPTGKESQRRCAWVFSRYRRQLDNCNVHTQGLVIADPGSRTTPTVASRLVSQPNILLVMADQLAPHFTSAYGHPLVRTPTLDSLAERGARFDAAYSHSPLCAPARFSMMSGQPVSSIGAWDNASEFPASVPTLAHCMALAGYRTILSGKMHFVGPDQLHGFDERLTTDIYPADFAWTPNWDAPGERIGKWYHNMDSLSEAGQALATYQIDYDEEVGFAFRAPPSTISRGAATTGRSSSLRRSSTPTTPTWPDPSGWSLYDHDDIDLPDDPPDSADPHTLRIRKRHRGRHHRIHRGAVPQRASRLLRQHQLLRLLGSAACSGRSTETGHRDDTVV